MPRVTHIQTNFTAGEISPRLMGRVDISRYANGAKTIENGIPLIHGGVVRRPGLLKIDTINNGDTRLIPFIFSTTQAYMLVFGDHTMRVYQNRAPVMNPAAPAQVYQIATPYSAAMLKDLDYVQGADTMFITHPNVPMQRLQRFADDLWVLEPTPLVVEPFDEIGHRFNATMTLSAIVQGSATATSSAATFNQGDIGREIVAGTGIAKITGFTSATSVTVSITHAFSQAVYGANLWLINASPQANLTPSGKEPIGTSITLTSSKTVVTPGVTNQTTKPVTGRTTGGFGSMLSVTNHGYSVGDTIALAGAGVLDGQYHVAIVSDVNTFFIDLIWIQGDAGSDPPPYTNSETVTRVGIVGVAATSSEVPLNIFRTEDVGKVIRINRGIVKITAVNSPSQVTGDILTALDAVVTAPPNAWTLESSVWNPINGYPRTVTLYEQRLIAGGSPGFPQSVWGSRTGEYLNFTPGVKDDDAFSFTVVSDEINPIAHLAQTDILIGLTYGGEFSMFGGLEKPITPTNVQIKNHSVYGCNQVRPVRIGKELNFIQRSHRKLRGMSLDYYARSSQTPDLTVLSEHVTESGIVDMCYAQEPNSVVWLVRGDGQMATLTLDREQEVTAWARQSFEGTIQSVASVPSDVGDDIYVAIQRKLLGEVYVTTIEIFDDSVFMDGSIWASSGPGAATWTGLTHLEGFVVDVTADGFVMPQQQVNNGSITLPRPAHVVQIGLPFATTIETLTPEFPGGMGSAQGNSMRNSEVTLRFLNTIGCKVNGQEMPFQFFGNALLNTPPQLFTGDHRIETLGWDRGSAIIKIEQTQPLPFHLQAVITKFTVNDG